MNAPRYYFDSSYKEVATLRNGQQVHLRLLRPSDKVLLRAGLRRMSPESRYHRFCSVKDDLTASELRYLTEIDHVNHLALGSIRINENGEVEGLGVARFIRLTDRPDTAEVAIAVIDEMHNQGLGSLLFQRLIAAAWERGIQRCRCDVMPDNEPMLRFMREVAPDAMYTRADGLVGIEFDLPPLEPGHPVQHPPRSNALYQFFQLVARGEFDTSRLSMRWFEDADPGVDQGATQGPDNHREVERN